MDVGWSMVAKKGFNLPTFLFNLPLVSLAPVINLLHLTKKAKMDLHCTCYCMKGALGMVSYSHSERTEMKQLFERLSGWEPELYVHEKDIICEGYIDYFEQRQQVQQERRFPGIADLGMMLSLHNMLWTNTYFRDGHAHDLQQWWKPDGDLRLSDRRYPAIQDRERI
uniref:Uncharacterized protein n=1 Tax=Leersia perrieri TaxID=77586 RepID=A0A0D9WZP2_9ORYZ